MMVAELDTLDVALLGPMEVRRDGVPLPLGGGKQRAVLAMLVMRANRSVGLDELVGELWGDQPTASAVANVRTYAANLRRLLAGRDGADAPLTRSGSGYRLSLAAGHCDALTFLDRVRDGRDAMAREEFAAAAEVLGAALLLWRGVALDGIPTGPALDGHRDLLEQTRGGAMEDLAEARLRLGRGADAAALLRELLAADPLRERAYELLMKSLRQSGDVAGALEVYQEARAALIDRLGIEPGPALRELHQRVLAGESGLVPVVRPPVAVAEPAPAPLTVPAQLPADLATFTGRSEELGHLDRLLAGRDGRQPTTALVTAVAGTAGVGKTALTVRWAHQVRDQFPDGQLYVNLRGFGPTGSAMTPAEALRGFFDALDVPPGRIPEDLHAQTALYRSLLTGKRVLIVLDNARDAEQVRPLLPSWPGCLTLITSRNQLASLVAVEGARLVTLDLPPDADSRLMLADRLGEERVAHEPDAVEQIIAGCARLPLALAIVAARAAAHPEFPLSALAAELRDVRHGGLYALTAGDETTDVRAVFSWSYHALSTPAARVFRLLGLHFGESVSTAAAASMAGLPYGVVRPLLGELAAAHLLQERLPGRYSFHDLLRAYATEQVEQREAAEERRAAVHRMLDHYLHSMSGAAAILVFNPGSPMVTPQPAWPLVTVVSHVDRSGALAWCTAERPALIAAIRYAAAEGFDRHACQLAWTVADFLDRRGHWADFVETQRIALETARRLGDRPGEARSCGDLARAWARQGRWAEAYELTQRALEINTELGDATQLARTHTHLSAVLDFQGRTREGLEHALRALDYYLVEGSARGTAAALNNVGYMYAELGEHERGLPYCIEGLEGFRRNGDLVGEAQALDSIGYIRHRRGELPESAACFQNTIRIYRDLGERRGEATALTQLGDVWRDAGDVTEARTAWGQALAIFEELGHPLADELRDRLREAAPEA
jgi:DNA-binding SARP family transcriptional activator